MEFVANSAAVSSATRQVMAGIEKMAKTNKNKFGGYNFVSVDNIFEMTGPLMAEAGINIVANEVEASTEDKHLTIRYNLFVTHDSGEYVGPYARTITVQATGPQAYGSAESYILKQFMRGFFKIPTGDAEEETFNNAENDPSAILPNRKAKKDPPAPEMLSASDSSRERDVMLKNLTLCTSSDEMLKWAQNTAQMRNKLHTADREALKAAYLDLQKSLKKEAA